MFESFCPGASLFNPTSNCVTEGADCIVNDVDEYIDMAFLNDTVEFIQVAEPVVGL